MRSKQLVGEPRGKVGLRCGFQMLAAKFDVVRGSETDDLDVPDLLRFRIDRGIR